MTFEELLTENGSKPQLVEFLYDLEDNSQYWNSCVMFFNSNHQKPIAKMTDKQAKWAQTICEDVLEKYIEEINGRQYEQRKSIV